MEKPIHPGIHVKDALGAHTDAHLFGYEFVGDLNIAQAALMIGVSRSTLSRVINGRSGISPKMADKLAKFLGTTVSMWLDMQHLYNLEIQGLIGG